MFRCVQEQAAALRDQPVALFFSGGKDAIAAAHMWRKYHHGEHHWCYLYFVDGLEIVERTLRYYEKAWGIRIDRRPCYETKTIQSKATATPKKFTLGDDYREYIAEKGIEWILTGEKISDGMMRRFRMQKLCDENMIDWKYKKVFPVGHWTNNQAMAYVKSNRLPLPVSYQTFSRSLWIPDIRALQWLRGTFPADYRKIIETFPQYEDAMFRADRGL